MAPVALRLKVVGGGGGRHLSDALLRTPVDDLDDAFAHAGDQQIAIVRRHHDSRRGGGDRHDPDDLLRPEADRHDFVGVLQGHEDKLAAVVEGHVRGGFRCRQAGNQAEVRWVIEIDPVQAQRRGDEPFPVRRVAQLIRIGNVADAFLFLTGGRVEEHQLVGGGTGNDHGFLVGGRHQVVRFLAHRRLAGDLVGLGIDQADRAVCRVQGNRQQRVCRGGRAQQQDHQQPSGRPADDVGEEEGDHRGQSQAFFWISSTLYPSGSSTKAITVVPCCIGPASRTTLPPRALICAQAA